MGHPFPGALVLYVPGPSRILFFIFCFSVLEIELRTSHTGVKHCSLSSRPSPMKGIPTSQHHQSPVPTGSSTSTQLQPETFGLFFYESIMSIPKMNPYATPFLQDLPSRVLRDTPPHTPVSINAPHLVCQHSPLEEMPNHDHH